LFGTSLVMMAGSALFSSISRLQDMAAAGHEHTTMNKALGVAWLPMASVEKGWMTIAIGYETDWNNRIYTPHRGIYIRLA